MRISLNWTTPASRDLLAILRYITRKSSPEAATRVTHRIVRVTDRLLAFPESGRLLPNFPDSGFREVFAFQYRIVYHFSPDRAAVDVIRVRHMKRRLRKEDFAGFID